MKKFLFEVEKCFVLAKRYLMHLLIKNYSVVFVPAVRRSVVGVMLLKPIGSIHANKDIARDISDRVGNFRAWMYNSVHCIVS